MAIFLTGGCEATIPEKTESLYASIRSWGTGEEDNRHFSD